MAKYKYSGSKTKAHPKGDFRKHKPKLVRNRGGGWVWIQQADSFAGGRWESGVGYPYPLHLARGKIFKTKAEALKHRPKW